jgi:hypothetical protein
LDANVAIGFGFGSDYGEKDRAASEKQVIGL